MLILINFNIIQALCHSVELNHGTYHQMSSILIVIFMFLNNTGRTIEISDFKFIVIMKSIKLSLDGYISLNSFGYGGANGHLVLKPYRNHCSNQGEQLKQTGYIVLVW